MWSANPMTNKTQLWVKPDPPGCGRGAREGLRGAAQGREFSVDLRGAEKRAGEGHGWSQDLAD